METEDGLFGYPGGPGQQAVSAATSLPGWQVDALRRRLDGLGLATMRDRQAVIERIVGRSVRALRELSFAEARKVEEELVKRRRPRETGESAWDARDGETWIDRL